MQFVTCKEANKTGGNFYSERGKETRNKTKQKTKTEQKHKIKTEWKKRERERGRERSEDDAVLTKLSPVKASSDRTSCFKGSYWLASPTLSKEKALSSLRLARKSLLPEC